MKGCNSIAPPIVLCSVRPIYRSNRLVIGIGQLIGSANQTNPNIGSVLDRPIITACIGRSNIKAVSNKHSGKKM